MVTVHSLHSYLKFTFQKDNRYGKNKNYVNKQNAQKYIDKTKKNGIMNLTNDNL